MNGKIFAIFLLTLCVTQGLNARSIHEYTSRISDDDVVKTLNNLINKIHKAVENVQEVIQNFEEKVKEDAGDINLLQIIADLEKEIENIAEKCDSTLVDTIRCLMQQQPALRDLQFVATNGVDYCLSQTEQTKNQITKKLTEISLKAVASIANIPGGMMKCFNYSANKINSCLKSFVNPSKKEVEALLLDIEVTIKESNKLTEVAKEDLIKCVSQGEKEIKNTENLILNNFQKCVRK